MSKTKPTILIIENSVAITGALKSITRTAYDLQSTYSFLFILPRKSQGRTWVEGKGFKVIHELRMIELSRRLSSLILYIPYLLINVIKLKRIIRKHDVDLIHVNDLYNLLPVVLNLFGTDTPYVCHVRFLPNRFPTILFNFWIKCHLRYAFEIIAVSQFLKDTLPSNPMISYIPNELPNEERYNENFIEDGIHTFLYLSNYMKGKGQEYALEAFGRAQSVLPNWRLRFVGSDMGMKKNKKFKDELTRKAEQKGISEKIDFVAFTEDVEKEYKSADIVLNFSESESFSITCLEALYFGRPLIATDCGGPAEIIDHNETGLIVKNRDIEEMTNSIIRLALDKNKRENLGNKARNIVRERFSIENTSFKLRLVYNRAISLKNEV